MLLILFGLNGICLSTNASENGIIDYNNSKGLGENSADNVPEASNPSDIDVTHGDSNGIMFKVPGSNKTYYADKNSPLWKQLHSHGHSGKDSSGLTKSEIKDLLKDHKPKKHHRHKKDKTIKRIKYTRNNKLRAAHATLLLFGTVAFVGVSGAWGLDTYRRKHPSKHFIRYRK